jgi:geranylgeranyl reductase family protein
MDTYDVLIVGAGPAGSSCAWKLRNSGLTTMILDKQIFPRDKVCGGWITPPVLQELEIDPGEYACGRVLQPIHGFRISRMDGREVETDYGKPISYGIRRCEFDDFLLKRSGAHIQEGMPLTKLERSGSCWIANAQFSASLVVGAGGHFCPVARYRGANARNEVSVAAQEIEFEMSESQQNQCSIRPEFPELYFCHDMKGYGWCVRKKNFLNVGLGRLDSHALPQHVVNFIEFLNKRGKVTFDLPLAMAGHSYLLYGYSRRNLAGDGVLLIGDAAGLAYSQSGEGIRPAVESGLIAAKAILTAGETSDPNLFEIYRSLLAERFGKSQREWAFHVGQLLPTGLVSFLSRFLVARRWFSRHIILERWFLHADEPALSS